MIDVSRVSITDWEGLYGRPFYVNPAARFISLGGKAQARAGGPDGDDWGELLAGLPTGIAYVAERRLGEHYRAEQGLPEPFTVLVVRCSGLHEGEALGVVTSSGKRWSYLVTLPGSTGPVEPDDGPDDATALALAPAGPLDPLGELATAWRGLASRAPQGLDLAWIGWALAALGWCAWHAFLITLYIGYYALIGAWWLCKISFLVLWPFLKITITCITLGYWSPSLSRRRGRGRGKKRRSFRY